MQGRKSKIETARSMAMTRTEAAHLLHISDPTMAKKEKKPDRMTIGQFFSLYESLPQDARDIAWSYLEDRRDFFAVK